VPDVPEQFRALTPRPEAMGFHIGVSPDPSSCKHYQGIARVDAADGTPYFIVTRSGNTPDLGLDVWDSSDAACDDSDGESGKGTLIAVRMGSRDTNGERLRSNRLAHGLTITSTPPDASDTAVMHFQFDGRFGLPNYGHPGGMQVVGHVLAVALEHSYDPVFPRPPWRSSTSVIRSSPFCRACSPRNGRCAARRARWASRLFPTTAI
jgi:hypothetical protein